CLSFGVVREARKWTPKEIKRFEVVARIFANALVRKRGEEALRESEEHLAQASEAAGAGLWDMEIDTGQIWAKRRRRELMHLEAEEELSLEKFIRAVHPEDRVRIMRAAREALETGAEMRVEHRILLPDGGIRWLNGRGRRHCDASGKPNRLTGASV